MRSGVLTASIALVVVLAGCGQGGGDAPSETSGCDDAMAAAAAETDSTGAEPLIIDTLTACDSTDQWMEALRRRPGVLGIADDAAISDDDLEAACYGHEETPVCADALEQGRLRFDSRDS